MLRAESMSDATMATNIASSLMILSRSQEGILDRTDGAGWCPLSGNNAAQLRPKESSTSIAPQPAKHLMRTRPSSTSRTEREGLRSGCAGHNANHLPGPVARTPESRAMKVQCAIEPRLASVQRDRRSERRCIPILTPRYIYVCAGTRFRPRTERHWLEFGPVGLRARRGLARPLKPSNQVSVDGSCKMNSPTGLS
jgi:hypothetical protein